MTCRRIENQLDDYLDRTPGDGTLGAEALTAIERHVADCRDCARLLERAASLKGALAALPVEGPRPGFFEEALAAAEGSRAATRKRIWRAWHVGALAAGLAAAAIVVLSTTNLEQIDPAAPAVGIAQVALAIEEAQTINLVFASEEALEGVSLTVDLPPGVELARYPGQERVRWSTRLQAGKNVLPLELVAHGGTGGELVATMRRDGKEKVFRVSIDIQMG
jgi:predicted anti-sigma-YlaC factor YlaD